MKLSRVYKILFCIIICTLNNSPADGNYQISLLEYEIIKKNDTEFVNLDNLKLKRKSRNETHKIYGSFTFIQEWTSADDILFIAELYKKQGGEYRKTAYHVKGHPCILIETQQDMFKSLGDACGFPEQVIYIFSYFFSLNFLNYVFNISVHYLLKHTSSPMDGFLM